MHSPLLPCALLPTTFFNLHSQPQLVCTAALCSCVTEASDSAVVLLQEDAHCAVLEVDPSNQTGFFGVFDGHGGQEVAKYCSLRMVCLHVLRASVELDSECSARVSRISKSVSSARLILNSSLVLAGTGADQHALISAGQASRGTEGCVSAY